jgi:hypothetical protein
MSQLQRLYNIEVWNGGLLRIWIEAVMTYLQAYLNICKEIWRGDLTFVPVQSVTAKLICPVLDMLL